MISLRARFAIGMASMLLPLVLSIAVGQLYLLPRLTQSLEKVVEEVLEEMVPVVHLQNALLEAAMPANDYLIHGNPAERKNFTRLSQGVDRAFEEALAAPYALEEERTLVEAAHEEWQQARSLSEAILALPNPVGDPTGAEEMERLDAHVDRAVELLDQQHVLAHHEADEQLTAAQADRQRGEFLTVGAFGVALAIAIVASVGLAHSVLAPVHALRQGALRFGEGDLSYRLAVEGQDELGQLARGLNEMAEQLEKSQEMLHRRANEFTALYETACDLAAIQRDLPALLQTIVERAPRLLDAAGASIYLYDPASEELELSFQTAPTAPLGTRLKWGEGAAGRAALTRAAVIVNDYQQWEFAAPQYLQTAVRAVLEVPMIFGGELIGTLGVAEGARSTREFAEQDAHLLSLFASQAASAVHNARLFTAVQEELSERQRYEFIVNASHELMTLINQDRRYEAVNVAYSQAHDKTREAFIGRTVAEVWGEEVYQRDIKPHLDRCLAGRIERYQEWFPFADSEPRCFDVTYYPYSGQAGTVTHAVVVSHDITALKQAEEALRESETRFKSLFEDSPISLWAEDFSRVAAYIDELRQSGVTDFRAYFGNHPEAVAQCAAMATVVDVNKATLRLYKAKSKEALLAGLNLVLSEEGFPTFREELIAIAGGKTRFEAEVGNQTLTGEKIHLVLSWSVAPGYEKTYSQVFVSINDITARRRVEEKLAATVTELEQHSHEITLLNEMGDLLQTCQTVEEASTVVAQFARKLFPNQSGALCLTAASRNLVEAVATWGESPPQERVFTPDDCWALRRGQTHSVVDPRSGPLCKHVSQPVTNGYLCVPMMAQGEMLGILHLQSGQPGLSRTQEERAALMASQQQLAVTLAEHIALALANLKLREALRQQAIRDPLTGLFNRRYMEETLERELRRAERRKAPLGVIMFDLDHFKKFNDTFGHAAGDMVLRETSAFLRASVRVEDIACRYGGEEFVVILPESSLDDTLKRAEQLREGTKQLQVQYRDQILGTVTVSLGVAVFPEHGSTTEAIMKTADAALYRAKTEGRDRVVVASG